MTSRTLVPFPVSFSVEQTINPITKRDYLDDDLQKFALLCTFSRQLDPTSPGYVLEKNPHLTEYLEYQLTLHAMDVREKYVSASLYRNQQKHIDELVQIFAVKKLPLEALDRADKLDLALYWLEGMYRTGFNSSRYGELDTLVDSYSPKLELVR